jgi:hypothetical protein
LKLEIETSHVHIEHVVIVLRKQEFRDCVR